MLPQRLVSFRTSGIRGRAASDVTQSRSVDPALETLHVSVDPTDLALFTPRTTWDQLLRHNPFICSLTSDISHLTSLVISEEPGCAVVFPFGSLDQPVWR